MGKVAKMGRFHGWDTLARRRTAAGIVAAAVLTIFGPAQNAVAQGKDGMPSKAQLAVMAISAKQSIERAFNAGGIEGAIGAVRGCYAKLNPQSPIRDRVGCVSLDLAAFYLEEAAPSDFKKLDMKMDDYLSKRHLNRRLNTYLPPSSRPSDYKARLANFGLIVDAYQGH